MLYRQGDVLIEQVQKIIPEDAVRVPSDDGRVILAYGEVTGHAHALAETVATLFQAGGERYLQVTKGAVLRHEEHAAIKLPEGTYRVIQQREYTPQEIRNVAD